MYAAGLKVCFFALNFCCTQVKGEAAYLRSKATFHKGIWKSGVQLSTFLISTADAGGFHLHTWMPYAWGKISGTHKTGGWVGPRASLDMVVKKEFLKFIKNEFKKFHFFK